MKVNYYSALKVALGLCFLSSGLFVQHELVAFRPVYSLLLFCLPILYLMNRLFTVKKSILIVLICLISFNLLVGIFFGIFSLKGMVLIFIVLLSFEIFLKVISLLGVERVFKMYLSICFFSSILIIIQQMGSILGVTFLYDYSFIIPSYHVEKVGWLVRANSFFSEPAGVAYFMGVGFVYSLASVINKTFCEPSEKKLCLTIAMAYPLTFSSLGVLVIIASATILIASKISFRSLVIIFLAFFIVNFLILEQLEGFVERFDVVMDVIKDPSNATFNLSVWAIYSNIIVMKHSVINLFPFGAGFGNHGIYYDSNYNELLSMYNMDSYRLNSEDAASLLVRIFSELGLLLGISFLLFCSFSFLKSLIVYFQNKKSKNSYIFLSANICMLIILLRHGNYLSMSTVFVFSLIFYYLSKKHESINC